MSMTADQRFTFKLVSKHEVEQQLKSIKRNKTTKSDDLPPGLIKDKTGLVFAPLAHLIS